MWMFMKKKKIILFGNKNIINRKIDNSIEYLDILFFSWKMLWYSIVPIEQEIRTMMRFRFVK